MKFLLFLHNLYLNETALRTNLFEVLQNDKRKLMIYNLNNSILETKNSENCCILKTIKC